MKNLLPLLSLTLWTFASAVSGATNIDDATGNWTGALDVGQVKLRVVFKISKNASGGLTAKMDSPDQGARDIPVDVVTLKEKELRLEIKAVQGTYEGTLNPSGKSLAGKWKQGPNSLPLNLVKGSGTEAVSEAEKLSPADAAANQQAALKVAGTWNGTLVAGAASFRLRLNFAKSTTGAATGTIDSVDQGANGIPLSTITHKAGKIRFEARGMGAVYEGTLAADGSLLAGQWQQAGQNLPLSFKKAARP